MAAVRPSCRRDERSSVMTVEIVVYDLRVYDGSTRCPSHGHRRDGNN